MYIDSTVERVLLPKISPFVEETIPVICQPFSVRRPPPKKNKISDFRPTTYNTVTRPTTQPPTAAAARNPNFRGSRCTLTGRGSRTHPNWSGQKFQVAFGGNSHSAPAGRMVYNIYGLCGRWWKGGGVTRRLQARFWSLVQTPKIAN